MTYSKEQKQQVLELLQSKRAYKEITNRTGILPVTIESWAGIWRKEGLLTAYVKAGMEFSQKAKIMSRGYYPSLRKRYLGMKWTDKVENREFGFDNPTQAIHYYLDETGKPRPCAYCGAYPPDSKVWGLDRVDSNFGHKPGNLVPCCSSNQNSAYMSCQVSKSKFTLFSWMKINMSRACGKQVDDDTVLRRVREVEQLAKELNNITITE